MTEAQRGANGRTVRTAASSGGWGERAPVPAPAHARDRGHEAPPAPGPAAEAAISYAERLGWPLTPGFPVDGDLCGCGLEQCPEYGSHPVPGAWRLAACATPTLVRVVWRMCTGSPVLAVLGRPVPGAARLGAVRAPALIGVAALELLSKRSAAQGPAVDGHGRISFLVDLGVGPEQAQDAEADFEPWHRAGLDLDVLGADEGARSYVPLPTPGFTGTAGVVWAAAPRTGRALPPLSAVAEVFDRAVRATYPSLWRTVRTRAA
jgi:hypothetical protein